MQVDNSIQTTTLHDHLAGLTSSSTMSSRSKSPPLPTFGIRDLAGPSNPPSLVSISRSQYESTIKSQPDAKLLYLDEDDGELITVGSSLELSQRLEEPVPKYTRQNWSETIHPTQGQLVHVFDIRHSSGSLAEWRDHEAYSSKTLRPRSRSPSLDYASPTPIHYTSYPPFHAPASWPATVDQAPTAPADLEDKSSTTETLADAPKTEELDEATPAKNNGHSPEIMNIIDGIGEHLTGLANVLQLAANTLQKAADKTRETDTSVVEDILYGVKGILTEVGSFGREAYNEFSREIAPEASESFPTEPTRQNTIDHARHTAAVLAKAVEEQIDQGKIERQEPQPTKAVVTVLEESDINDGSFKRSSRVKFASVAEDAFEDAAVSIGSSSSNPIVIDEDASSDEANGKGKALTSSEPVRTPHNPSILDDSSDDADFLARYPPLRSIRRARSTIETGRHVSPESDSPRFFTRGRRDYEPAVERANAAAAATAKALASHTAKVTEETQDTLNVKDRGRLPFIPFQLQPDVPAKPESTENTRKPLPGAWPDAKNESTPTLPVSGESSGAFFNRMIGRSHNERSNTGLHRANTTASSNPASRLNGPFDPGFPYDPSSGSSYRPMRSHPYRAYRRSTSPSRLFNEQLEAARARRVEQMKNIPKLDTRPSMQNIPRDRVGFGPATPPTSNTSNSKPMGYSKFESHRGVRHHRSVPHFGHFAAPPPPPPTQPIPMKNLDARPRFGDIIPPRPDFLSGPSPSNPPPIPFTARPAFIPHLPQTVPFRPLRSGPNLLPDDNIAQNTPAVPAALSSPRNMTTFNPSHISSPSTISLSSAREDNGSYWRLDSPPSQQQPIQTPSTTSQANTHATVVPEKNKFDSCVEHLKMCGFGCDDDNLRDRLHVYAVAANGDVTEAVEMIEEDRRLSRSFD